MNVWIYENGAEEFESYRPYFTLISVLLMAAFKLCKGEKQRKDGKERKIKEWRERETEKKKKDCLSF